MSRTIALVTCLLLLGGCLTVLPSSGNFADDKPPVVAPETSDEGVVDLDTAAYDWFNSEHYIWEDWKETVGEW